MKRTRRNHSAEFKPQVAVFKSDKALLELADSFGAHPTQVTEWSQRPRVQRSDTQDGLGNLQVLRTKIGQVTREHDLKRRSSRQEG